MLKKIALYFTAFAAIAVYALCENEVFMRFYTHKILTSDVKGFRDNKNEYGDLYAMSYLKDFKEAVHPFTDSLKALPPEEKQTDVWMIGDSFLSYYNPAAGDSTLYRSQLHYIYSPYIENFVPKEISFDKENHRKKILVIERTERFLTTEFTDTMWTNTYLKFYPVIDKTAGETVAAQTTTPAAPEEKRPLRKTLKLKWNKPEIVNQNLETVLFGYGLFTPFKEWKAQLNYKLFSRVNDKVYPSVDGRNLYFHETVDPKSKTSSFIPVTDLQIDTIVANLNYIAETYKKRGFDEMVYSFIPNAVTIEDPALGTYNDIIHRIEQSPNRRFSFFNIYDTFKSASNPRSLYRRNDTHWNAKGFALWIDRLNAYLKSKTDSL